MSSLVELVSELSSSCYSIGSCHWVEVTHINSTDDFYVRPVAYKCHLRMLEACEGPVDESRIKPGCVVVYKSPIRKGHIRGQIKNVRDEGEKMCEMFALDYGFIESVSADCLKSPKREGMPALSVCCQLDLRQPMGREIDKKAVEALIFYTGNEPAKIIIKGQTADKLIVQLINTCPEDISTMLPYSEDSTYGSENNSANRLTCTYQPKLFYTYKKVNAGDSMIMRLQSVKSLRNFYMTDLPSYRSFMAEYNNLCMYLNLEPEMKPEDVKPGKPVAVYNGYKYERAVVKEITIPGRKAIIQLVDTGSIKEMSIQRNGLKALEREYYFLHPALAIFCSTEGFRERNEGFADLLYPGNEFIITVNKVSDDFETPNIVSMNKIT